MSGSHTERVPAMCAQCGAVRDVARGLALRRGERLTLTCAGCARPHAQHLPLLDDVDDWREIENELAPNLARELVRVIDRIESFGVEVRFDGEPEHRIAMTRWLDDNTRVFTVPAELAVREQLAALKDGWLAALTFDFDGLTVTDDDGTPCEAFVWEQVADETPTTHHQDRTDHARP